MSCGTMMKNIPRIVFISLDHEEPKRGFKPDSASRETTYERFQDVHLHNNIFSHSNLDIISLSFLRQ